MSTAEAEAVLDAIREALEGDPLTRDELADAVAQRLGDARLGETVRGSFGTLPKLAALRGDLCFAPPRGRPALHAPGPLARRIGCRVAA